MFSGLLAKQSKNNLIHSPSFSCVFRSLTFQALICCSVLVPSFLELWVQFQFKLFFVGMRKSVVKSSCGLYWLWLMGSGCLCTSRISLGRLLLYFRVGNGGTALKMKLYNTTLSGKPILYSWKLWESSENEFIQYFFFRKAYFKVGNCMRAPKMQLYNTS